MTQTFRTSRRVYQQSPAAAGDGVLTNPLARVTGAAGSMSVTTEADRTRLFDGGNPFTPAADFLGRMVSMTDTPPSTGSAGTNKYDDQWYLITDVDAGGGWIELEGFRTDDAGTGINYTIHASVDFAATSAAFSIDEGPLGPNSAPFPALRTNTGPTVGQAIFFPGASDPILRSQPFVVGALDPGGGGPSTTCRLVDFTGRYSTLPTATGQRWELRDLPAYTEEMLYFLMHRFLLLCGWDLEQSRGKNNGTGAGRFIVRDNVYRSVGEAGDKLAFCRMIAANNGTSTDGSFSSDNGPAKGYDFALFSAWDRNFTNTSGINPGNGVGAISPIEHGNNRWASAADTLNTSTNGQGPWWSPDIGGGTSTQSAIGDIVGWRSRFHSNSTKQFERNNSLGTVEGGDLVEIHYSFIGDRDEVHLVAERHGFGNSYIGFGFLESRADQNPTIFEMNRGASSGANVTLRIGGLPGNPTSDGIDPQNPGGGNPPYRIGDQIQVAGKTVNAGVTPGGQSPAGSHSGEFVTPGQIISFPGLLPAEGTIETPGGAQVVDGDTITISDGSSSETFEFDSGGGVTGGNVAVAFTGGDSAATIASALNTAINGTALNLSSTVASSTVTITSGLTGSGVGAGNVAFTSSLGNPAQWTLDGMNGGGWSLEVAQLGANYAAGAKVGEDPDPIFIYTHHKSDRNTSLNTDPFDNDGAFILGNRAQAGNATYEDGALPGGNATLDGYFGYESFGPLETIDNFGEVNPSRRSGRFVLIPLIARDQEGSQLRGTMKFMRMVSARLPDHKFVPDRDNDYHYIVPTFLNDPDGETTAQSLAHHWVLGPIPEDHVIV